MITSRRGLLAGSAAMATGAIAGCALPAGAGRAAATPFDIAASTIPIVGTPEFCECDKITGEDCFVARLHLQSLEQLDGILDRIANRAETNTSIVKAQTIPRRLPPFAAR